MAAATMMVATFGACSNDDLAVEETPALNSKILTLTTTLEADGGSTTRSTMTDEGTSISTAWEVGDKIWVNYDNTSDENCVAKGSVTAVDGSGRATVTVDLINPKDASVIVFGFPYDHWTEAKDIRIDQIGTLNDIKLNHASISGSGTLTVSGSDVTLPGSVSMNQELCIWKLNFTSGTDITNQITSLHISFGAGDDYIVTPNAQSNIYVALYPEDAANITIKAATATGIYSVSKAGITLDAGKFYRSSVALTAAAASDTYRVFTDRTTYSDEAIPDGATTVTSGMTSWEAGTYVVSGNVTIDGAVSCSGDINLILKDGASLTINGTFTAYGYAINIYGQELSTGKLDVVASDINLVAESINIHGGIITVTEGGVLQGIEGADINIYHGTVTAAGMMNGFSVMGDMHIYGGKVTASATNGDALILYGSGVPGSLTISGGTFIATGEGTGIFSRGIMVTDGSGDGTATITITGGTVIASGGSDDATTPGGCGIEVCGNLTISGNAKVLAHGGMDMNGNGGGYGINVRGSKAGGNATISGGTTTLTGGEQMAALNVGGDLTISGATTEIDAMGGQSMEGILAGGAINISGGKITARGGSEGGIGLEGTTTITGGFVTAIGGNGVVSSMENGAAGFDGTLNMTGGKLIATGGAKAGDGTDGLGISDGSTIALSGVTMYEGDAANPATPAANQSACTKRYVKIQ